MISYSSSILFLLVISFVVIVTHGYAPNTDRIGIHFYNSTTANAGACETLCRSQTACATWVWYTTTTKCFLKSGLFTPSLSTNSTSGVKSGFLLGDWNRDRVGANLTTYTLAANATAQNCKALCDSNAGCASWSFGTVAAYSTSTLCEIKSSAPALTSKSNSISGVKGATKYGICPSTGNNWVKWSTFFGSTIRVNATVVIADVNILLDVSPPIIYNLTIVSGGLFFDPTWAPTTGNPILSLKAYNIFVGSGGVLVVGCAAQPWNQSAEIVLYGRRSMYTSTVLNTTPGRKVIAVQSGGIIQIYAKMDGPTWTKLGSTAMPNSNTIVLVDEVQWKAGQQIVIASSDENAENSETRSIITIGADQKTITLDAPLKYRHWGQLWQSNGDAVDIRSEVGLLSRLVKVTSDATVDPDSDINGTRFGGHIIMLRGSLGQLYGAEVTLMGQASFMARYPVHFHIMADTSYGCLVEKLSIHNNYQRSLTIHYSNGVIIKDVVAYKTFGHMYFFEDGVEQYNVLTHNLGINTFSPRLADRLMITDDTPSIFWITSPVNSWYNNSAVGSRFGYWFSLPATSIGIAKVFNVTSYSQQSAVIAFEGNSAHSNVQFGLNIDDGIVANPPCPDLPMGNSDPLCGATARFVWASREIVVPMNATPAQAALILLNAPTKLSLFKNNTFWKIPGHAFWSRGSNHILENTMFADNGIAEKHPDGTGILALNGVFVAATEAANGRTCYGYTAYDAGGPNFAVGNRFYNYNKTHGAISGQSPHVRIGWDVHLQNHFFNSPNFYNGGAAASSAPDLILDDYDGSLTGKCGSSLVKGDHLITRDCVLTSGGYGYACPASPPRRRIYMTPFLQSGVNATFNPINVVRLDNRANETRRSEINTYLGVYYEFSVVTTGTYWVQVPGEPSPINATISLGGFLSLNDNLNKSQPAEWVHVVWNYPKGTTFSIYDMSPIRNFTQVSSKAALVDHTYYFDSTNEWLYVHLQNTGVNTYIMTRNFSMPRNTFNIVLKANCPNSNCAPANPNKLPAAGADPAPSGPRLGCAYKPTVNFVQVGSNTLLVAKNGTVGSGWNPSSIVFVNDPYGSNQKVILANLTLSLAISANKFNLSLATYNYLHFSMAVKGAGQRGLLVSLVQGSNSSTRVSVTNPWYLPGGQTPDDTTKWVEIYVPLSAFDRLNPTSNITQIQFVSDGAKNYMAYLNNIYFASVQATNYSGI